MKLLLTRSNYMILENSPYEIGLNPYSSNVSDKYFKKWDSFFPQNFTFFMDYFLFLMCLLLSDSSFSLLHILLFVSC